ncbi:rhomboid family intramembrane serine protease, partial [Aldersonia kunmingensis]|uniref:rhomboid family intramembrane serine protease n=1 Tax=Aldersonia kunmingensis TaxID=408066 RepID=UPI0009FD9A7D
MNQPGGYPNPHGSQPLPGCVRHPDRPTGLTCVRCGRPACPECLREAAVGYQCVDCVRAGAATVRAPRTVAGATMSTGFTPVVTYALIAINVVVYAITVLQSGSVIENDRGSQLFRDWALWPPAVADGQLFRLIGSGFLHYGALHLAVNMFALWIVGRDIERVLGRSRYTLVYFVSLLGGSAAVMALELNAVTAGASGAIFGLFGALGIILLRLRQNPGPIIAIIVINVVISVATPGISLWGHLGGLAAGTAAAVALLFVPGWLRPSGTPAAQRVIGWSALAAVGLIALV